MKALTTTLIVLYLGLSASAQNLRKNDSIVEVNGGLQLVYKKSKVAVYYEDELYQKPSKNLFITDEIHEIVFEIDLKTNEIYGLAVNENEVKKLQLSEGLNISLDATKIVELQPEWSGKIELVANQINVQIKDELVYYHFHDQSSSKPLDNIYHSGLYSKDQEDYVFQSITQPLFNIADRYFTTLTEEEDTCFQQLKWNKGKLEIENECVNEFQPQELQKIINVDEVIPTFSKGYYYTIKNKQWGFIYLDIENSIYTYEEGDSYSLKEHNIHFDFNVLEPNKNDFIYQSALWDQYVVFKDGNLTWVGYHYQSPLENKYAREVATQFSSYTTNYEVAHIFIDGAVKDAYEDTSLFNYMSVMNGGFGVIQINDTLFIVNDYMEDEKIIVYDPETGYEMYDEYGYPLEKTILGLKNSGVYDIKNNEWVLDQGFHYVDYYGGSIICALNSSENEKPAQRYYDLKGNEVKLDLSSKAGEYDFYNKAFSSKKEVVERANSDYFNNRHFPDTIGSPDELLFYDGVSYRFVPIDDYFISNKVPEEKRYDFIQNSIASKTLDKMNYQFVISNDMPYFLMNCQGEESSIELKDQDFELVVEDFLGEAYSAYSFYVIVRYEDTTAYYWLNDSYSLEVTNQKKYSEPIADLSESMSVLKKGNVLAINSSEYIEEISWSDPDAFWGDEEQESKSWEIEGSSVWRKDDEGIWKQVSDDYAQLMHTPFGYIAKTGFYEDNWVDPETREMKHEKHNAYFEILDEKGVKKNITEDTLTDCNVFVEGQYYMFEINGLNNWKLVDQHGNFVSDESFDFFKQEGKVIYGIDRELYDIDEFGYGKYNEEGNPILLQKARKVKLN